MITPLSWEYIRAYNFYKKNILPNGNGWLNESDKFLSAMTLIDNLLDKEYTKETQKGSKNG